MPGGSVPFSLEPIMVEIEEGRYIGPFLPVSLYELVAGRRSTGEGAPQSGGGGSNGDDGGGRNKKPLTKVDATGGRGGGFKQARYDAHLPSLSLWDGENSRFILVGVVLPIPHSHVLFNNWHL